MATREEETVQWLAIGLNSRKAAQHLLDEECYRSSISRSYYAAYAAITGELVQLGIPFSQGRDGPSHAGLPAYILNNLNVLPQTVRFELNKAIRRLYASRVEADYVVAAISDKAVAVSSLRDLRHVLLLLDIDKKGAYR
jgi:uncharacterized protein (UPF0332 family)